MEKPREAFHAGSLQKKQSERLSLEANREGSGKGPSPGGVGGKAALRHPQGDWQCHSTGTLIQKERNPRGIKPKESESCVRGEELN